MFNQCDVIGRQSYRIRWKKQNKGNYAVQGHGGRYQSKARVLDRALTYLVKLIYSSLNLTGLTFLDNFSDSRIVHKLKKRCVHSQ